MTFNEHVSAIEIIISSGVASKDLRLSRRVIGHFLNVARSTLIKNSDTTYSRQGICIPMESTNFSDICRDCELPESCSAILKSTEPIPGLLSTITQSPIVRTIDGSPMGQTTLTNLRNTKYSLTQQSTKGWFIFNGHLYIALSKDSTDIRFIPLVILDAVFKSPEKISSLSICGGTDSNSICRENNTTEDYPFPMELEGHLYTEAIRLLSNAYRFGNDSSNDARELAKSILQEGRQNKR